MIMNLLIVLMWSSFLACQTVSSEFAEAKKLEKEGQLSQAFDLYTQLEKEYSGTSVAKESSSALQRIYLNYAKAQEEKNPEKAVQLYQKMLKRWPQDTVAVLAEKKIEKLQKGVENQEKKLEKVSVSLEEVAFCERARGGSSRIVWQQYKQGYPEGSCLDEANEFLERAEPRESELDEMKLLVRECQKVLKAACQEYNLSKTISDRNACNHSSRSFKSERERLIRRKKVLLEEGNQEYYQNFIPKRWEAVKSGIDSSCQATMDFLNEKESLAIDLEPFNEIIKGDCGICLENFGSIEHL
jgi:tetratricopeptide (TPR) repeat protein